MNRKLFSANAILLVAAVPAAAQHVEIARFEDNTRVYADAWQAQRSSARALLTHLVRWGEAQQDGELPTYRSTRVFMEYDCPGKRERYLGSASYAGPAGDGALVTADGTAASEDAPATPWDSISEASMEEALWRLACGVSPDQK